MTDERLFGAWVTEEVYIDGEWSSEQMGLVSVYADGVSWWKFGSMQSRPIKYVTATADSPHCIDFITPATQMRSLGIYEIVDDRLRMCLGRDGDSKRPTSFETKGTPWAFSISRRLPRIPTRDTDMDQDRP